MLIISSILLAQIDTIRETTIVPFSRPQFFTALVAGLFLTFGFQMLLTNLSVAVGISVVNFSVHDDDSRSSPSSGSTVHTIGTAVGVWTLVTVSIALFVACLLAVKLSLVPTAMMGATIGLSIWAAYFSILIWISSTTVGSLVGSVVNTATRGFQAVFGTATAALGMKAAGSEFVSSAEAAAAAVRRDAIADTEGLQKGIQTRVTTQWQQVQDYLRNTGKDELNPEGIKRDIQKLLDDPQAGFHDIKQRASSFDRDTLVQLLAQRPDLSPNQVNNILDGVESNWHQVTHAPAAIVDKAKAQYENTTSAIADYLRRTGKSELNPDGIKRDLTTLLHDPKTGLESIRDRLGQIDRDTLVQLLRQRDDLTEAEANEAIDHVQSTIRQVLRTPQRLAIRAKSKIHDFETTLEDYLRNTDKQELNPDGIKRDLGLLLQDPRLGLEHLGDRLKHIDRETMIALLSQRKDISPAEAEQIVVGGAYRR
jgi:hypothetical protein